MRKLGPQLECRQWSARVTRHKWDDTLFDAKQAVQPGELASPERDLLLGIMRKSANMVPMTGTSPLMDGIIGVSTGIIFAAIGRRARLGTFRAAEAIGDGETLISLTAGPWTGKTVKIKGLPATNTALSSWTWGLAGHDIHNGHYVVREVDPTQHTAHSDTMAR